MSSTPSPVPSAPAEAPQAKLSAMQRVIGVFASPGETFADIARKPTWLVPVLLYCAISLAVIAVFTQRVGWESYMRKQMEKSSRFDQLSEEQKQQQLQIGAKVAPYSGGVMVVIITFALFTAGAGLVMLGLRTATSAQFGYKTSLGVFAHGMLPLAVSGLVGIIVLFLKDPSTVDLEHLVGSNLGGFVSSESPKWLLALASSVDVFSIWAICLLALGYRAINPKRINTGTALAIVIVVWLIGVAVKVALAQAR